MQNSRKLLSRSKIEVIRNIPLSNVVGYSGLFLTTFCCLLWILSRCLHSVILPRIHNDYRKLEPPRDRIAVNFHYLAFTIKFVVFVCIIYPFTQVIFRGANFDESIAPGGKVSHGDILLLMGNLFCSLFIFELFYRTEFISWMSAAHHIGTVIVGQLGIALSAYHTRYQESSIELYMCTVWAMFELVSTFPVDPLMIFYRWNKNKSQILPYLCAACGIWGLSFTLAEIAATIFLLHASWNMWSLPFQTITPIVFSIWCGAQFKYCHTMYGIYLTQKKALERTSSGNLGSPVSSERKDMEVLGQLPV